MQILRFAVCLGTAHNCKNTIHKITTYFRIACVSRGYSMRTIIRLLYHFISFPKLSTYSFIPPPSGANNVLS